MMKQQIRQLTGKEGVTEQSYRFAGKKYKKKSDAPISDPLPDRKSDSTPLDRQIFALNKKSRELTAKAEKASGDAKRGLEAKRHQIQVQLQKLRKKRGF